MAKSDTDLLGKLKAARDELDRIEKQQVPAAQAVDDSRNAFWDLVGPPRLGIRFWRTPDLGSGLMMTGGGLVAGLLLASASGILIMPLAAIIVSGFVVLKLSGKFGIGK